MQVGIFAAIPLVADREKLILKRLAATPLRRWQLVGSNVLMRLLIALIQAMIIVAVGALAVRRRDRRRAGRWRRRSSPSARWRSWRSATCIASFAKTEDAANGMTSDDPVPDDVPVGRVLPDRPDAAVLQAVARLIPLTYLADALRQVMVGGAAFAPLWVCAAVLVGWLVVCFGIAARKFRGSSRAARRELAYQRSSWTISSSAPPAAGLGRPGEVARVGRIAERQQVLAALVGRVAEQARGRGRARRRSPGRCRSRAPRPPASCSARPGRGRTGSTAARSAGVRVRRDQGDRRRPRRRGGRRTARPRTAPRDAPGRGRR